MLSLILSLSSKQFSYAHLGKSIETAGTYIGLIIKELFALEETSKFCCGLVWPCKLFLSLDFQILHLKLDPQSNNIARLVERMTCNLGSTNSNTGHVDPLWHGMPKKIKRYQKNWYFCLPPTAGTNLSGNCSRQCVRQNNLIIVATPTPTS